ncbi:hypothetical protein GCM10025879_03410 [Leuconostoc litchii]|nr:hypothetical protein GCM10025879_03410 [Leuconostoc litchii]
MTVLYSRNALGEALAYAFIPLVFLGCFKIWHNKKNGWLYLGIGMGAIANSHILSLIIITVMIIICFFIRLLHRQITIKELQNYIKATVLAILSALYTLTNMGSLLLSNLLVSPGPNLIPLNTTKYWQALLDNSIIERADSFNIGVINTGLIIFLAFMLFTNKNGVWRYWSVATIILFFSTFDWLPWQNFVNTPINVIQFLGRLLFLVSMLLSISVMYYFNAYPLKHNDINVLVIFGLITLSLSAVHSYHNTVTQDGYRFWLTKENYYKTIKNSAIGLDYLPANNKKQLQARIPAFQSNNTLDLKINSQTYNAIDYTVNATKSSYYTLPVAIYSGVTYKVTLNHQNIKHLSQHALKLKLRKGSNHLKVAASVNKTNYFTMLVSLLAIVYSIGQLFISRTHIFK